MMCGIAGIFNYHSLKESSEQSIRKMLSIIRHRGPDESGIYLGENMATFKEKAAMKAMLEAHRT
jgi:asparagine synthase (glutamine-hydrolysing)